jgi:antitoxin (DNA-binding transcriptional repressor) of toxin-antitoxin stability system
MIEDINMEPIRMTDAEVTRDFAAVLEKLKLGHEVVVEQDRRPVAVIKPVQGPGRLLSECIALAKAHGSTATLDDAFGKDLEEIIESHPESLDASRWD